MTKKAVSKLTGMNQSLVSQYANGEKVPGPKQRRRIEQALHNFGEDLCSVSL
jgi:transcriptional regulator with XRE-family HTH domain